MSDQLDNLECLPAGRLLPVGEDGGASALVRDEVPVLGDRLELELGAILHIHTNVPRNKEIVVTQRKHAAVVIPLVIAYMVELGHASHDYK